MGAERRDERGAAARRRGCHLRFVLDVALAFGGFALIWGPRPWLTYLGALASLGFTFGAAREAWRLAAERRVSDGPPTV